MAHWLYKYVFRGIGIVFLAGLITNLYLVISSHRHQQAPTTLQHRAPGDKR
jgi:hypothetical protein